MCYCHQIWIAKIKFAREWCGKAHTSACKGDILFMHPTITHAKVLYNKVLQNTSDGYFCTQWRLRIVMHFNGKRLCYVNNIPHLCILYLSLLFFVYLPIKAHVKYQRRSLLNQQNAANQGLFYSLTVPINNNTYFEKRNALFSKEIFQNTCKSRRV